MEKVLVTDLIMEFDASIKRQDPYIEVSRKYNQLARFLGPVELEGLREAWGYFETPDAAVFPYAFDDTINFLLKQCEGMVVDKPLTS